MPRPDTGSSTTGAFHSFLTEEQQAILDAALAERKVQKDAPSAATPRTEPHPPRRGSVRPHLARKSGPQAGLSAGLRKAGAGGRRAAAALGLARDSQGAPAVLDSKDPNYDSGEGEEDEEDGYEAFVSGGTGQEGNGQGGDGPAPPAAARSARDETLLNARVPTGRRATALAAYKASVDALLDEYGATGDLLTASEALVALREPELNGWFVARVVARALDGRDREREDASALLAALGGGALAREDVADGFARLAERIDDLTLDVPDAPALVALFAARAVSDDALAPAWIEDLARAHAAGGGGTPTAARTEGGAAGAAAVANPDETPSQRLRALAAAHLAARHGAERLARCWHHGGTGAGVSGARAAISAALDEAAGEGGVDEARRALRDLGAPWFRHELVFQACTRGLVALAAVRESRADGAPADVDAAAAQLLAHPAIATMDELVADGTVPLSQVSRGLRRAREGLTDLALDAPGVEAGWPALAALATRRGWVADAGPGAATDVPEAARGAAGRDAAAAGSPEALAGALATAALGGPAPAPSTSSAPRSPTRMEAYKAASTAIAIELFASGEVAEAAEALAALGDPGARPLFVAALIRAAMDRGDAERELASRLLTGAGRDVLPPADVAAGLARLLARAEDLTLDVPDAPRLLALFLARASADEVLPPKALRALHEGFSQPTAPRGPSLEDDAAATAAAGRAAELERETRPALAASVVHAAICAVEARHGGERLESAWSRRAEGVRELRAALDELLDEYEASSDLAEARRAFRELGVPHFGHELVFRALARALAEGAGEPGDGEPGDDGQRSGSSAALLGLLADFEGVGLLSASQVSQGIGRVQASIGDIELDVPGAGARLPRVISLAQRQGWWDGTVPGKGAERGGSPSNDGAPAPPALATAPAPPAVPSPQPVVAGGE